MTWTLGLDNDLDTELRQLEQEGLIEVVTDSHGASEYEVTRKGYLEAERRLEARGTPAFR